MNWLNDVWRNAPNSRVRFRSRSYRSRYRGSGYRGSSDGVIEPWERLLFGVAILIHIVCALARDSKDGE